MHEQFLRSLLVFRIVYLSCLCLLATATFAEEGTTVYKTEDKSGNPVFSDQSSPTSEKIKVEDPLTFPAAEVKKNAGAFNNGATRSRPEMKAPVVYKTLLISSPLDQDTIRNNAGNMTVEIVTQSKIAPQHQLELLVDGNINAVYDGNPFNLQNLDRGEHALQLQIRNSESGQIYKSSPVVSITMLRHSSLHKKRQPR
jgi:hypothetical protein